MKKISIFQAKPGMVISRDLFNKDGSLLLTKGSRLNGALVKKLLALGVSNLHVESIPMDVSQKANPLRGVERLPDKELPLPDMISVTIRIEAENVVREMMEDIKSGRMVKFNNIKRVVEKITSELLGKKKITAKLADIRFLDDYTFAHSVNVCVLAISTGILMNYSPVKLRELGISALMHDVGKVFVPTKILNKPGNLTVEELNIVRKHPENGYRYIKNNKDICQVAARVALEHHEHYNGNGYPRKLRKQAIHEYSQIVAIADVYDALTSNRVYKNASRPHEAVEIIMSLAGYQFAPDLVKVFIENLSVYPEGSIVRLNNGCIAEVIAVDSSYPIRPKVRLLTDQEGRDIEEAEECDLMFSPTIFIENIIKV